MVWECGPEARVRRRVSRLHQGHRSLHPRLRSYQALCDTDKGQEEVHTTQIARGTQLTVVGNNIKLSTYFFHVTNFQNSMKLENKISIYCFRYDFMVVK